MWTRDMPVHQYAPGEHPRTVTPGAMVIRPAGNDSDKHIDVMMAIARPNSSPASDGAPFYLTGPMGTGSYCPNGMFAHGGTLPFTPTKPKLEMDPSDSSTWQRDYRFT